MIKLEDISASIENKRILKDVNIVIPDKGISVIIGPNGSGKSTLLKTIAGHPKIKLLSGRILLDSEDITNLDPEERFKRGIFLVFQEPVALPISTLRFYETVYNLFNNKDLDSTLPEDVKNEILRLFRKFNLDESLLYRNLHEGFSGGEKKKIESILALILKPKHPLFDEPDTGMDINSIKVLAEQLNSMKKQSGIVIVTHNLYMIDYLDYDNIFLVKNGYVREISEKDLEKIKDKGFDSV